MHYLGNIRQKRSSDIQYHGIGTTYMYPSLFPSEEIRTYVPVLPSPQGTVTVVAGTLVKGHSIPYSGSPPKGQPESGEVDSDPGQDTRSDNHEPTSLICVCLSSLLSPTLLTPSFPLSLPLSFSPSCPIARPLSFFHSFSLPYPPMPTVLVAQEALLSKVPPRCYLQ